ncbi:YbaB/EbfC family nucleoid-associated protein [Actinoplanes aureus]|uniref:YbaB/EbfC family nucleoid-associated protein n=1 Tax=Actinoplanes aureus TaxID=2792083 RepID=A0A931CHV5_9ACTN|nr:YbaB/EbfC family nucleoid-associated protein [Actinoplanes aureus]MBG0566741.1 YbaB/EbfC family nucleoid-associated protein [Actinoplanes aureus]
MTSEFSLNGLPAHVDETLTRMRSVMGADPGAQPVHGRGQDPAGHVRVTVAPGGYLDLLDLDPRWLCQSDAEQVSAAIREAVRDAVDDARRQLSRQNPAEEIEAIVRVLDETLDGIANDVARAQSRISGR